MTVKTKAENLNDEQREAFREYFYEYLSDINDEDSPSPWGEPWLHGYTVYLDGFTVIEQAENYYNEVKKEMKEYK